MSFWDNVVLMFGQYLLMPICFMLLAVVSIRWNKIGSLLHLLVAMAAYLLFGKTQPGFLLVAVPLAGLALLYWFARLERRKLAYIIVYNGGVWPRLKK